MARRGKASEGGRSPLPSYLGARRVPAPARRAALDPSAVLRAAGGAAVRPLEGAGGLERAAVLQQGLRRLSPALEDGPQVGVQARKVRGAYLHLLELVGRLVEHGELEVNATEGEGEGEAFRSAGARILVEGDHPGGPPSVAIELLDAGQEGQRGIRFERTLPDAERLSTVTAPEMRVAQGHGGGEEVRLRAQRLAEAADGGLNLPLPQERSAELEVDPRQPGLLGRTLGGAGGCLEALLSLQGARPVPALRAQIAERAHGGQVVRRLDEQPLEHGGCVVGPARAPVVFRGRQHELGTVVRAKRVEMVHEGAMGVAGCGGPP